jgi:hypothetical protein
LWNYEDTLEDTKDLRFSNNKERILNLSGCLKTNSIQAYHNQVITKMSSSDRQKFPAELDNYSESELIEDYKKLVISNPQNLNLAAEHILESLVDDAIMGVAFQMHFESKYPVCLVIIFI